MMPALPRFTDTHCHLEMRDFDPDREEVIKRAALAGVQRLITIGSDMESSRKSVELSSKYDMVFSSIGVHPHDARNFIPEDFNKLFTLAQEEKVVAIGETGLDYHYDKSPRDVQKKIFRTHLDLAGELDLPVIVHSREAMNDTLGILKESGLSKGVLHCFSGDMNSAEKAMGMGFYISIAGPVTYKKSTSLKEIAARVPDDYLLIETDSPYLSPEPFRGKRNEPAHIINTATEIAALRGVSLEDVARITTLNAARLFGLGEVSREGAISYRIRDSLYLNITNRCTNACSFCVRFYTDYVKGHMLRLEHEPSVAEIESSIGDPLEYKEIVFCGYGEPLIRLDVVKEVASWVKSRGGRVRINTNGHGNLINKRNILPELRGIIDVVSVSLDAQDEAAYERLCKPAYKNAYTAVLEFIKEAKKFIPEVQATVVEMEGVDMKACQELASGLGVPLRTRKLDAVG